MRTGSPGFSCCKDFRNNPRRLRFISFSMCFGPNGTDVTSKTVMERRAALKSIFKPGAGIQLGSFVEGEGKALFELTRAKGMEGVVAKCKNSIYRPGKRSSHWLKIKSRPQQEFVVGGFTEGQGSRKNLGALLLGAYRNGRFHYFGHAGSGFSDKGLREAIERLQPLFTDKSPFENPPRVPEKIQWVKPKLVCAVSFAEWTRGGELRLTVFLGWRDDKKAKEVVLERP
jgi:bifunctional non-homologous end joining protein LigD